MAHSAVLKLPVLWQLILLLLLDEPAAGMNPQETLELKELVINLRDKHSLSVLLIEHDMNMVMSLSDRIYVMEYGSKIAEGHHKK